MNATKEYGCFASPLGELLVTGDDGILTGLYFPNHKHWRGLEASWQRCDASFAKVREQLAEYFAGERQVFDLPIKLEGTPFQQRVWDELTRIPFGVTISYAQLAQRVGNPAASRAVGLANGRNPVSIVVPCHRVIGASGKLTGYGGGLDNKRWLIDWERGETGSSPRTLFEVDGERQEKTPANDDQLLHSR